MNKCRLVSNVFMNLKKIAYRTTQKSLVNKSLRKCYIKSISLFINIRSTNVTERDTLTEETVVVPMVCTYIKRFTHVFILTRRLFSCSHMLRVRVKDLHCYAICCVKQIVLRDLDLDENIIFFPCY